jgi:hypothetical protein
MHHKPPISAYEVNADQVVFKHLACASSKSVKNHIKTNVFTNKGTSL